MNSKGFVRDEMEGRPPDRGKQPLITEYLRPRTTLVPVGVGEGRPKEINGGHKERISDDLSNHRPAEKRSYSTVVGKAIPDVGQLPEPIHAGSLTKIIIPQDTYEERLLRFRFALIGRVNFRFISLDNIRKEAEKSWNLKGNVKMAPMGKGYILFQFDTEANMASMWRTSLTKVRGQIIRFQPWRPDFDVHTNNPSTKLMWIRFPDLPLKYWHERILLTMAKAVGRPVALDKHTRSAAMGTYACAQVEIEIGAKRLEDFRS
ncbi:uncharacterized protein LOC122074208 [Macadamia integrifolia]|uniref:uncharacterized protein LOC122074208 n=1 Tax=Macadamia integrifolia TaxID=60698 RepID=UPI001C4E692E|nr:uncharacterized protein LOC122074208 [Macadamia integrifolia]